MTIAGSTVSKVSIVDAHHGAAAPVEDEETSLRIDGDAITMRTERFRYAHYERDNYQGDRNYFPSKGSCELFDHQADPGENNNIAGKTEYAEHLRSVEAQFEAGWTGAVPAN